MNQPSNRTGRSALGLAALSLALTPGCAPQTSKPPASGSQPDIVVASAKTAVEQGRQTFRYDTFGDEAFWGGKLQLHKAIAGAQLGGFGAGLSPQDALSLGLKVDVDALPASLVEGLEDGKVDLESPATTLALLEIDAVVGVKGFFDESMNLTSVGITCALCHATVDDSFSAGIGSRRDGWPNRDLDVGAIAALAPDLTPFTEVLGVPEATVRQVLASWGPGRYDAHLLLDGKAFRPDQKTAAVLLPAAFGMAGVNLHTYTGWGSVTYWNASVANLQMHGQGTFTDTRLDDAAQFPVAAANALGHIQGTPDRITPKLGALQIYQLSLVPPKPPAGSFDAEAATRGALVFQGKGRCSECHVPPTFSDPGWNLHTPAEIGIDDFQSSRSPTKAYRTTPLRGLFTRAKGGYYHDGRFATLEAVVAHYDAHLALGLTAEQKEDLVEYLASL